MLVVLPFCAADRAATLNLAAWIGELGGCHNHDMLLIHGHDTTPDGVKEAFEKVFRSVKVTSPVDDVRGWPQGPNSMFSAAVWYVFQFLKVPFLWMEPDAIPLVRDWIDRIEAEYKEKGKAFMGWRVDEPYVCVHMSGVAVYPAYALNFFSERLLSLENEAFDTFLKDNIMRDVHWTRLIHHKFWMSEGVQPTFPTKESTSFVNDDAVIFHRNKDHTLIDRLRGTPCVVHGAQREVATGSLDSPHETHGTPIYTYFEEVTGINSDDSRKLIELWKTEWSKAGYRPIVLGRGDAEKHPQYKKLLKVFESFPSINPKGYDLACWLRWLAVSAAGGGWMSDYDCYPLEARFGDQCADFEFFSGNDRDPFIPCIVRGSAEAYDGVLQMFANHKHDGKHTSDMLVFTNSKTYPANVSFHAHRTVREYGESGWKNGPAVHFSNHSMSPHGFSPRWKYIPQLLNEARRGSASSLEPAYFPKNSGVVIKPTEPLTVAEAIAALVEHAKKDSLAKGRIVKALRKAELIK